MKHLSRSKILVIFAVGILSLVAGIFFTIYFASENVEAFPFFAFLMVLLGTVFVYLAISFFKDTMLLYAGLVFWTIGIMFLLMDTNMVPWTQKQLWPIIMILCGVFLYPSGFFRYRKARTTYIFPASAMVLLGLLFSLFSFRVIKISFVEFVTQWWPVMLIVIGLFLIVVFFFQQRYQALFPYINENAADLSMDDAQEPSEK